MISGIDSSFDPAALGLAVPEEVEREELGREEFLQLMLTQLENQDPFKPMESGEFLGQLAQFGTVTGLGELQESFESLSGSLISDQALQAASLVGRSVTIEAGEGLLQADGPLTGAVEVPIGSSSVSVQIRDAAGQVIRQLELGSQPEGVTAFRWSGETDTGLAAPPGRYSVSAQYFNGQEMQSTSTLIDAAVESVTVGAGGLAINLEGLGAVPFDAVREIGRAPASIGLQTPVDSGNAIDLENAIDAASSVDTEN